MNSAVVEVSATFIIIAAIASRLHNINLTTSGPLSIHRLFRHHPDSRPDPIALGQLGNNLDSSISNTFVALGRQARRSHRRNHAALGRIGSYNAGRILITRTRAIAAILRDVEGIIGEQLVSGDRSCLVGQSWDNV